jgi:hypothetical protein
MTQAKTWNGGNLTWGFCSICILYTLLHCKKTKMDLYQHLKIKLGSTFVEKEQVGTQYSKTTINTHLVTEKKPYLIF